jgi:hypothetical protein
MSDNGQRRNRKPLIIMAILFLLPAAAASIVYKFFPELVHSMATSNNGTFVVPVRKIDMSGLKTLAGKPLSDKVFRDKWTYLYIDSSRCDDVCRLSLYNTHQVREAQGKNIARLQRILVLTDTGNLKTLQSKLTKYHPRMLVAVIDAKHKAAFLKQFTVKKKTAMQARRTYIVDPIGQLMMFYEPEKKIDFKKAVRGIEMLQDMKKLMHNSRAGS